MTSLYGLLFWDVLFADIPGAFETRYQSAPLDIAEDTFIHSRKEIVERRIASLLDKGTNIADVIRQAYDEHEKQLCVGVRWDLFQKEELAEIAEVSNTCPYIEVKLTLYPVHRGRRAICHLPAAH